jgi:hypothetical protein
MQHLLPQLASALILFFLIHCTASVLYVDLNCSTPMPTYANWSIASTNILDAVDASSDGETI